MPGFLISPDGLEPLLPDVSQHIVIDPLVGAKFHIAVRLHQHGLKRRHAPLGPWRAVGIEGIDLLALQAGKKNYFGVSF